jgi:hypothetical protein
LAKTIPPIGSSQECPLHPGTIRQSNFTWKRDGPFVVSGGTAYEIQDSDLACGRNPPSLFPLGIQLILENPNKEIRMIRVQPKSPALNAMKFNNRLEASDCLKVLKTLHLRFVDATPVARSAAFSPFSKTIKQCRNHGLPNAN